MPLYIYLYEGKPLISDILGKTYAKTLQSMVTFFVFFVLGQKISATFGVLRMGGRLKNAVKFIFRNIDVADIDIYTFKVSFIYLLVSITKAKP